MIQITSWYIHKRDRVGDHIITLEICINLIIVRFSYNRFQRRIASVDKHNKLRVNVNNSDSDNNVYDVSNNQNKASSI